MTSEGPVRRQRSLPALCLVVIATGIVLTWGFSTTRIALRQQHSDDPVRQPSGDVQLVCSPAISQGCVSRDLHTRSSAWQSIC